MVTDRFWDLLAKKLSGEANEAELGELDLLLQDPQLKGVEEHFLMLWHQNPVPDNHNALSAFEKHISRLQQTGHDFPAPVTSKVPEANKKSFAAFVTRKWFLYGAAAIILVGFFVFIKIRSGSSPSSVTQKPLSQVSTKPGSRTQIQLPDGSKVWLNASSNLSYNENFGKNLREVELTGEAYFDVAKDAAHPFIIHTKVIDVKVTGTELDIKAYPGDTYTETSLVRGNIEVTVKNMNNEKHYLYPNQKVIVANNVGIPQSVPEKKSNAGKPLLMIQPLSYSEDSSVIETSWVENKLVFDNESFADIATKMERWYNVHIQIADGEVAQYRLHGYFEKESVYQALEYLRLTSPFHYHVNKETIIITK